MLCTNCILRLLRPNNLNVLKVWKGDAEQTYKLGSTTYQPGKGEIGFSLGLGANDTKINVVRHISKNYELTNIGTKYRKEYLLDCC